MPAVKPGELRIIGGEWRSRKLLIVEAPGLRPTPDRVRETLFNWLQHDIPGAKVLDVFAGSGALGFEAASRGAAEVVMLENHPQAQRTLAGNIEKLGAQQVHLVCAEALAWLRQTSGRPFDVVFLDPPYASGLMGPCCELLEQRGLLVPGAKIYLEVAADQPLPALPRNWRLIRDKKAGEVGYHLAHRTDGDAN